MRKHRVRTLMFNEGDPAAVATDGHIELTAAK
jgi:hypothetical protein